MSDAPKRRRPVLIELDQREPDGAEAAATATAPSPQDAPPPPDVDALAQTAPRRRRGGFWGRLALWALGPIITIAGGLWLYGTVEAAIARSPILGAVASTLATVLAVALAVLILKEIAAIGRLRRVARLRATAERAVGPAGAAEEDRPAPDAPETRLAAEDALQGLERLYDGRAELAWARAEAEERGADAGDAAARLLAYERAVLGQLDGEARAVVRRAARRVAVATALMPSALLDAAASLFINLAMIRGVAQVYGGRAGFLGSLGLARRVIEHAMAAGLISLGDDLLEPLIGGGVASRLSRRIGEGVVNGAMTARIGIAAMAVCRPTPFVAMPRPKLRELAWEAIAGARRDTEEAAAPPRS